MHDILISVIIPCYNRSDVISRAVRSVFAQTYSNLEIIVVDDASENREKLELVLGENNDTRLRVIHHSENQGGAAARNTGVAHAKGEFVAFLDSDDEWLPTKLEKQFELASEQKNENWLIYCQSVVQTTQASALHHSVMPAAAIASGECVGDYLFTEKGWLPTPAMLLPRSLAVKVPFNPELRRHQDYDLLLRLEAQGCRFLMIADPLVVVHWEDFHETSRGLNPSGSLDFLALYGGYLSPQARSGFVNGQIVSRLLRAGRKWEAFRYALQHVRPWHLSSVDHVSLFSGLLFGDARLARTAAKVKRLLMDKVLG